MAKIVIKRKSSFLGGAQNHDVYLGNTFVGNLKNGGILEISAEIGVHILFFNSTMKKYGKNASFNVVINAPDEVVELKSSFGISGEYEVEYADTKPHIPIVTATNTQAPNFNVSENANAILHPKGICCPRCGSYDIIPVSEVSSKGRDFIASDACCGYLLCGPIGMLCGATGKGKQFTTTTYWMCKNCGNKFQG